MSYSTKENKNRVEVRFNGMAYSDISHFDCYNKSTRRSGIFALRDALMIVVYKKCFEKLDFLSVDIETSLGYICTVMTNAVKVWEESNFITLASTSLKNLDVIAVIRTLLIALKKHCDVKVHAKYNQELQFASSKTTTDLRNVFFKVVPFLRDLVLTSPYLKERRVIHRFPAVDSRLFNTMISPDGPRVFMRRELTEYEMYNGPRPDSMPLTPRPKKQKTAKELIFPCVSSPMQRSQTNVDLDDLAWFRSPTPLLDSDPAWPVSLSGHNVSPEHSEDTECALGTQQARSTTPPFRDLVMGTPEEAEHIPASNHAWFSVNALQPAAENTSSPARATRCVSSPEQALKDISSPEHDLSSESEEFSVLDCLLSPDCISSPGPSLEEYDLEHVSAHPLDCLLDASKDHVSEPAPDETHISSSMHAPETNQVLEPTPAENHVSSSIHAPETTQSLEHGTNAHPTHKRPLNFSQSLIRAALPPPPPRVAATTGMVLVHRVIVEIRNVFDNTTTKKVIDLDPGKSRSDDDLCCCDDSLISPSCIEHVPDHSATATPFERVLSRATAPPQLDRKRAR